jgi:cyclic lactone autoinducer peptide
MKQKIRNMLSASLTVVGSLALLVATSSVNSTCLFFAYQPDVPEELNN